MKQLAGCGVSLQCPAIYELEEADMKQLAGCGLVSECPAVHDDGDPETVIVVGAMLTHRELTALADRIGPGETAVRVPRSVIMDAGLLLVAAEKIRNVSKQE